MASLTDQAAGTHVTATPSDFEPDDRWKANLRKQIEQNLAPMVETAKEFDSKLLDSSLDQTTVSDKYKAMMREIVGIAEQHYQHAIEQERKERMWASRLVDQGTSETIKEQQEILDGIKRGSQPQSRTSTSDGAIPSEEPSRTPTVVVQRENPTIADQVVQERVRKQSTAANSTVDDIRPPRSVEDREPSHISRFIVQHRNDEPVLDRSSNVGSPPKPKPEIWKPTVASQDGSTSRTLAHATGTFSKTRRDSIASVSTTNPIRVTPEHRRGSESTSPTVEREHVRMQESDHIRSGLSRSKQQGRKSSSGADERSHVNHLASDSRRLDEHTVASSPTTSTASPSSYDALGYQSPVVAPSRPSANPRRTSTDESRQLLSPPNHIWFPSSKGTEPQPIKHKRSSREDDPGSFQPSPNRWVLIEENASYLPASSSPQEVARSWKSVSIRSRPSVTSLRYKPPSILTAPTKRYTEDDGFDSEPDLEDIEGWQEELSRRENETKIMEQQARKKEEELRQKEEAFRVKEKEAQKKEEEFKRKHEEIKRKEEEFKRKENEVKQKQEEIKQRQKEVKQKELEFREKEAEAEKKQLEAQKKEQEVRKKEMEAIAKAEEVKRQAEEARQKEEECKRKEAEAKRIEDETRKREAEAVRMEEEARLKEEEIRQKVKRIEKEAQQKQLEMKRKEEAAKRKEEEAKKQAEAAKQKEADAKKREREIRIKEEQLKRREKDLKLREADVQSKEQRREEEEEVRRARQDSISSDITLVSTMKEEELKRKEEELERREADLQQRESGIKLKEEEETKRCQLEAETKLREEEERKREVEAAAKLKEEEEAKLREEEESKKREQEAERQRDAQLEADRLEAIRVDAEWRQEDIERREQERKSELERHKAEADAQLLEETARKREAKFKEDQRKADDLRRQHEEHRRRDENIRSSGTPFPPLGASPSQATFQDFTSPKPSSSPTSPSRSSTGWASSSSRPTSTASSQASNTSRPTTTSASSGRAKAGGRPAGGGSTAGSSSYQNGPTPEEEWARRQAEYAQKQQEQFRKEQERIERERHAKSAKVLSQEDTVKIFHEHERQWSRIKTLDELGWESFPWPVFKRPLSKDDLTAPAIGAYVLSPHHPTDKTKTSKDRVKDHIKKWHPDRFETKLLTKVREEEKEKVKEGAGEVARNLNDLLDRSNSQDAVS